MDRTRMAAAAASSVVAAMPASGARRRDVGIENGQRASGRIALQYAAGSIKFRNVQVGKLE